METVTAEERLTIPLIFVGDGSEEALSQVDIKDKASSIACCPLNFRAMKAFEILRSKGAKMIFISHAKTKAEFDVVSNQIKSFSGTRDLSLNKPMRIVPFRAVFIVSPTMTEKFFGLSREKLLSIAAGGYKKSPLKKIKPVEITYRTTQIQIL